MILFMIVYLQIKIFSHTLIKERKKKRKKEKRKEGKKKKERKKERRPAIIFTSH